MIAASLSGTPVPAIARLVAADEDTVRDVIHPFRDGLPNLLISVVARFVARNGVLRVCPLCTVNRLRCADGLGEHRGGDEGIPRNA
jgi:hypothetical protein